MSGDRTIDTFLEEEQDAWSGALAATFSTEPLAEVPDGTNCITYGVTYTRGAAGGFPVFRVRISFGGQEYLLPRVAASAPAPPFVDVALGLERVIGPPPADGNPLRYVLTVAVPRGTTLAQLDAQEGGLPLTPGTVEITRTVSG